LVLLKNLSLHYSPETITTILIDFNTIYSHKRMLINDRNINTEKRELQHLFKKLFIHSLVKFW